MANLTLKNKGELVQFLSDGKADIRSLKVHFTPKQAGEGTPSPDNVREISGWNGVEVTHCGKNLLPSLDDTTYWKNGFFNSNGVGNTRADYRQSKQLVYIRAGQYVFSHLNTYVWIGIYVCDEHANKIYFKESQYNFTVNIPTDGYAKFYVQNIQDCQLEFGSTATAYEPYETRISDVLPSEYQEVEYIESTGTQWIKTGIPSRFSMDVESEIMFTASQDSYSVGFSDGNIRIGANGYYNERTQIGYCTQYRNGSIFNLYKNIKHKYKTTFKPGDQKVYLNDELLYTYTIPSPSTELSDVMVGIFGRCKGETADLLSKARIYNLTISDDDVILGNFVPCYRKSDKVPGMYDIVTKTFYTNSGTGEFLVGPSVNKYDVDWTEELGSVYGGYVDLVSGEVVKEWENKDAGTLNWNHQGISESYPYGFNYVNVSGKLKGIANVICEEYPTTSPASYSADKVSFGNAQNSVLYIIDSNYETASAFKAAMSGVKIVYELATPTLLTTLSPDILKTLTGKNTFWSNADYIEIEYDLIETQ